MSRLYLFCAGLIGLALLAAMPCRVMRAAAEAHAADAPADTTRRNPVDTGRGLLVFPPGTGSPVRVRASEDTLPENRVYEMPEVKVQEVRVPLLEIIRKAQAGERKKYDGIRTMAFTQSTKVTMSFTGRKRETRCLEKTSRIYFRAPDRWAEAPMRELRYKLDAGGERKPWDPDDEDDEVNVRDGRRLNELPFYLERLDRFNFRIIDRQYDRQQVLYRIAFEPKSDFGGLPGGTMWLLTNGYQIVHEEFHFKSLPAPWILKSIDLVTREWQQVEGHWVEKRITARAGLGLNFLGVPQAAEIVVQYDDYKFDLPLEERLFQGGGE